MAMRIVFSDASSLGVADVTRELLWMSGILAHADLGDSGLETDGPMVGVEFMFSRWCRQFM